MCLCVAQTNAVCAILHKRKIHSWFSGCRYRDFPVVNPQTISVSTSRAFRCNFVGTVYANSSREQLLRVIRDHRLQHSCFIKPRLR